MSSQIIIPKWLTSLRYAVTGILLLVAVGYSIYTILAGEYAELWSSLLVALFALRIFQHPVFWSGIGACFLGVFAVLSTFYSHMYLTRPEIGVETPFASVLTMILCHLPVYLLVLGFILLYLTPYFEKPSHTVTKNA